MCWSPIFSSYLKAVSGEINAREWNRTARLSGSGFFTLTLLDINFRLLSFSSFPINTISDGWIYLLWFTNSQTLRWFGSLLGFSEKKKIQPPVKDINGKFQEVHQRFKKKRGLPGGLIQKNVEFQRTVNMADYLW